MLYISQTEEFIFSCTNRAKLIMIKFDKNLDIYRNPDLISNTTLEYCITENCVKCTSPYLYSILYISQYKNSPDKQEYLEYFKSSKIIKFTKLLVEVKL